MRTSKPRVKIPVWQQYVDDVLSGKQVAGKWVILACKRHESDKKKKDIFFDHVAAQDAIDFFGYLHHSKGVWTGTVVKLEPWQQFIIASIFGWKRADGTRRYREALIAVGRGNGKTTLLSGLALYGLTGDREGGAEIYCFATKEEQAKELWLEALRMRNASPELAGVTETSHKSIFIPDTASKFMYLASESKTLDGKRAHFGIADELHEHPNRDLYDVIKSGMGTRTQPLQLAITTAGFAKASFCRALEEMGEKILMGIFENDAFFIYEAAINYDPTEKPDDRAYNDDPFDETNWVKANPNLGVSVSLDFLRLEAVNAKNDPTSYNNFLTKYMNLWVQQQKRWMPMEKWAKCGMDLKIDPMQARKNFIANNPARRCWAGLDLSSTTDLSSLVLIFPPIADEVDGVGNILKPGDPYTTVIPWFWCPKDTIPERVRTDKVPYDVWEREGFLTATEGEAIDYDFIRARLNELRKMFTIQEVGFDDWGATDISQKLMSEGAKIISVGQNYKSLNEPCKELLRLVVTRKLRHLDNPILTWQASNVAVNTDPQGYIKPNKAAAAERIDGIAATVNAFNRLLANAGAKKAAPKIYFI